MRRIHYGMPPENKTWGHGAKLRKARKARGLSLARAAEAAGISTMRACELEQMREMATTPAATAYCQLLGFRIVVRTVRLVRVAA